MQGVCLQLDGLPCARGATLLSRCGHYRLAGGRVEDALRAPLRGRAAPGPGPGPSLARDNDENGHIGYLALP